MHKEQARQEIVANCQETLEQTKGYIAQFEYFFEDYLADNNFEKSAQARDTLDKLIQFQQFIESLIANPTDANIEQYIKESEWFAEYCDELAK